MDPSTKKKEPSIVESNGGVVEKVRAPPPLACPRQVTRWLAWQWRRTRKLTLICLNRPMAWSQCRIGLEAKQNQQLRWELTLELGWRWCGRRHCSYNSSATTPDLNFDHSMCSRGNPMLKIIKVVPARLQKVTVSLVTPWRVRGLCPKPRFLRISWYPTPSELVHNIYFTSSLGDVVCNQILEPLGLLGVDE